MANAQKTCWTVVLFFLVMAAIPSLSDEGPRTKLFLKSGTVITCDQVWEGMGSGVFCQKSRGILVYWAEEIDFVKTFGASDVNETGAPYERIKREKRRIFNERNTATKKSDAHKRNGGNGKKAYLD